MPSFADKFKDPRWADKRYAILARAGHHCEDCDEDRNLYVHICYWEKDREPWDYPDNAYRCYCSFHLQERRLAERDIHVQVATFTNDELEPLRLALDQLAGIPEGNRRPWVGRIYPAAKEIREEYESNQLKLANEDID